MFCKSVYICWSSDQLDPQGHGLDIHYDLQGLPPRITVSIWTCFLCVFVIVMLLLTYLVGTQLTVRVKTRWELTFSSSDRRWVWESATRSLTLKRTSPARSFVFARSYWLRIIIWLKARLQSNIGFTLRRVLAVYVFGHNSAESEPIWMKSGALWLHCRRLTLADIGCDPCSSDSWRARQNLFFLSGK